MVWFKRKPKQELPPPASVIEPSVAERLDEATARLEGVVNALLARLDEFNLRGVPAPVTGPSQARKAPTKKPPAKKVAAKKAAPRKKES